MFPLGQGFPPSTGGAFFHSVILGNLVGLIGQQVRTQRQTLCLLGQRVHIPATGLYTYSDIAVVCGEPLSADEHQDTLLNPRLIIEVLSPTTEAYDRGKKFQHYQSIESLAEYLLVSQSEPRIEQFLRQDDNRWLLAAATGLDAMLPLPSIQCELALVEIYEKVDLAPRVEAPAVRLSEEALQKVWDNPDDDAYDRL
jgi:Uma2 family endonuclease